MIGLAASLLKIWYMIPILKYHDYRPNIGFTWFIDRKHCINWSKKHTACHLHEVHIYILGKVTAENSLIDIFSVKILYLNINYCNIDY